MLAAADWRDHLEVLKCLLGQFLCLDDLRNPMYKAAADYLRFIYANKT